MEFSLRTWIIGIAIFILAGFGLMQLVVQGTENRVKSCEAHCTSEGKRAVSLPIGTMGKTIESGSTGDWRMDAKTCQCISGADTPKQGK